MKQNYVRSKSSQPSVKCNSTTFFEAEMGFVNPKVRLGQVRLGVRLNRSKFFLQK